VSGWTYAKTGDRPAQLHGPYPTQIVAVRKCAYPSNGGYIQYGGIHATTREEAERLLQTILGERIRTIKPPLPGPEGEVPHA
jgi:hypothetical protein